MYEQDSNRDTISKACEKYVESHLRKAAKAGITLRIDEVIEQFYAK